MDCKTANQLIHPYIGKELDLETAESFLKHVQECKECREELEIYFTVHAAIDSLNQDEFDTYDLKGQFDEEIKETQRYIHKRHVIAAVRDIALLTASVGIAVTGMLQLGIWF